MPAAGRQHQRENCAAIPHPVFIDPPTGALQFEVTHCPNGEPVRRTYVVWVIPTRVKFIDDCQCRTHQRFEVLDLSLTKSERREVAESPRIAGFCVCSCLGRIVE